MESMDLIINMPTLHVLLPTHVVVFDLADHLVIELAKVELRHHLLHLVPGHRRQHLAEQIFATLCLYNLRVPLNRHEQSPVSHNLCRDVSGACKHILQLCPQFGYRVSPRGFLLLPAYGDAENDFRGIHDHRVQWIDDSKFLHGLRDLLSDMVDGALHLHPVLKAKERHNHLVCLLDFGTEFMNLRT